MWVKVALHCGEKFESRVEAQCSDMLMDGMRRTLNKKIPLQGICMLIVWAANLLLRGLRARFPFCESVILARCNV